MDVAFIGLGTMGEAMARNILKAGHRLIVHNRTRAKEESLAAEGAGRAASPQEAAAKAEVIIVCVSDTPDVEAMILGEDGVIKGARPGSVVVDMSTISPAATRKMSSALAEKGVGMLDAPVSGGTEGAKKGTLTVMIGGKEADLKKAMPVLETMGKSITHIGPSGAGQMCKAVNQTIISGVYMSVAEGVVLGLKAGLDMEKVVQALGGGVAGSWILANRSGNMIKGAYPLGFRISLHRKDLRIALGAASELGVTLPLAALAEQAANGLVARGYGDEDSSALARPIREQSGLD
jgi:3-hydroxyisobutyrate dehydrogenase